MVFAASMLSFEDKPDSVDSVADSIFFSLICFQLLLKILDLTLMFLRFSSRLCILMLGHGEIGDFQDVLKRAK